jgi:hypothetical protein
MDPGGLRVDAGFSMGANHPARVDAIDLRLVVGEPLTPTRRKALLAVVDHCTVHNSIPHPARRPDHADRRGRRGCGGPPHGPLDG